MSQAHYRILNNELLNNNPNVFPEQAPLIILDIKSAFCMAKHGKDNKHSKHISRRMHFATNGEECIFHKKVWCEGYIYLSDMVTKNVR